MNMDLARFNEDDIHELRIELAKHRSQMSEEEIRREINEGAEEMLREIEALRRQKKEAVGA